MAVMMAAMHGHNSGLKKRGVDDVGNLQSNYTPVSKWLIC